MLNKLGRIFSTGAAPEASQQESAGQVAPTAAPFERWTRESVAGRTVDLFLPTGCSMPPATAGAGEVAGGAEAENRADAPGDAGSPANAVPAGVVIFLHGHGGIGLTENETFTRLFEEHNLAVVAPDGGRSWWLDVVCPEFDAEITPHQWLIDSLLPFIESRLGFEPPKVAVMGVSMGGQGALQFVYRHAMQFPVVAAISPAIDFEQLYGHGLPLDDMFESKEDARQASVVLNLHPLNWPRHQWYCCDPNDTDWFDGAVRLGMKLSSSGIMHDRDLDTSAGGHTWDYFNHMAPTAIEFVARKLATL